MELAPIRRIFLAALNEDMVENDITTDALIPSDCAFRKAKIVAKEDGLLAGIEIAKDIFHLLSPQTRFTKHLHDGDAFNQNDTLLEMEALPSVILKGERVVLNFLQRLSGIATLTQEFVHLASPYGVKILDTRKTTPNLRLLEKYAVTVGGGLNHRFNLSSGILIKDNHVRIVGSVKKAVKRAKQNVPPFSRIEVEVTSLDEVKQVAPLAVDVIMLDNFNYQQIEKAIEIIRDTSQTTLIEVSGGITLDNVEPIAKLRPDFISVGKITHSAPNLDMSLKVV